MKKNRDSLRSKNLSAKTRSKPATNRRQKNAPIEKTPTASLTVAGAQAEVIVLHDGQLVLHRIVSRTSNSKPPLLLSVCGGPHTTPELENIVKVTVLSGTAQVTAPNGKPMTISEGNSAPLGDITGVFTLSAQSRGQYGFTQILAFGGEQPGRDLNVKFGGEQPGRDLNQPKTPAPGSG